MKTSKIVSIKKISNNSKRYDIQTKKTSNFFANGVLVHNSLIKVWFDKKWHISTNGMIDAKKAMSESCRSYYSLFVDCFNNSVNSNLNVSDIDHFLRLLSKRYTYMFEIAHPLNQIVVKHKEPKLYHLGTRSNILRVDVGLDIGIPKPCCYDFNSLDDIIKASEKLPYDQEGYVCVDKKHRRIKIKSPAYVAVHYLKNNGVFSYERVLEIILKNEMEEFLSYYDEFTDIYNEVNDKLNDLIKNTLNSVIYVQNRTFVDRKEYALVVKNYDLSGFFFAVLDSKYEWNQLKEYLNNVKLYRLIKILGLKFKKKEDV